MGLGAPKKRSKLSADPNNTAWSRDTTTFGHKILSKQGWTPGAYLGAEDATHTDHYTAANASHIRVMLREDNLGLGAKIGGGNAETFGLSMFSGLLGRLNGKDDAVLQKQQDARRDVELRMYQAGKYGMMNFVSGGLLVGDKMEPPKSTRIEDIHPQVLAVKEQSRKRKAEDDEGEDTDLVKKRRKAEKKAAKMAEDGEKATKKKKKKKRRGKAESSSNSDSSADDNEKSQKRSKKLKQISGPDGADDEKARAMAERRASKEERRKKKEEKRARRAQKEANDSKPSTQPTSAVVSESEAVSGTSTPTFMGGRQAVRHRYIMQKRMAAGNAQALKEIFMLKPQIAS